MLRTKPRPKTPPGKPFPIFVFESFQEASADTSRGRDFFELNFTQFAFALQAFPKRTFRHAVKTVLEQTLDSSAE